MGARDKNERKTSLMIMDGEVRTDEMVWGFGEGVDANVCSMSPIYRSDIVSMAVLRSM